MKKKKRLKKTVRKELVVFHILLILTVFLGTLNIAQAKGYFIPEVSTDIKEDIFTQVKTISLQEMSIEEKVAQMILVHGGAHNKAVWKKMQIGGIHFFAMESEQLYVDIISDFQDNMSIPFFVTVDLEGCLNPFANFKEFTPNEEISSINEASIKGEEEAEFLSSIGVTVNLAPVVDLDDTIWLCRSFPGDDKDIAELSSAYISSLQERGVSATAKHYPGKTLVVNDPHKSLVAAEINSEDIYPYNYLISKENAVDLVMVSHIITSGEVDSNHVPSSVSFEAIDSLKRTYDGLIISDDTMMLGLLDFYDGDIDQLYLDLVIAGQDILMNFNEDPNEIHNMITVISEAVIEGVITEERIDHSVKKILELKGFEVVE